MRIASPTKFQPPAGLLQAAGGNIIVTEDLAKAAKGADVLYTDVWVSMGREEETAFRLAQLQTYQISKDLLTLAPQGVVMHCLPAYREKEITEEVMEQHAETIFQQAENRLHAQKAILHLLVDEQKNE
jgi:ornithine carbamoyltransferase